MGDAMLSLMISLAQGALPYVTLPKLGPIQPFGVIVVTGILIASRFADKRAERLGLDVKKFQALCTWTVFSGILISHVVDQVAYYPRSIIEEPWKLLYFWTNLSSFGGMFGAAVGFNLYARKHKLDIWKSCDSIAYGLPIGFFFGRLGCAVVHDHPGIFSDSFIAVAYPEGNRLDLGLIEMLLLPILIGLMFWVDKRVKWHGQVTAVLALSYPFLRFPLDFLRAPAADGGDVRYFGLTPGHYAAIAMLVAGAFIWRRSKAAAQPAGGARREGLPATR
jgi:phosphatidylglycerol---prolipoprotein diacylglyceryl transferase